MSVCFSFSSGHQPSNGHSFDMISMPLVLMGMVVVDCGDIATVARGRDRTQQQKTPTSYFYMYATTIHMIRGIMPKQKCQIFVDSRTLSTSRGDLREISGSNSLKL